MIGRRVGTWIITSVQGEKFPSYPHIHSPYILLILIFYYLVIYTVVVGRVDMWISIQKCFYLLSLKYLTPASQADLYHVDNLSTAHFGVDRLWIKLLSMGITCNERARVIPIIWGMWISYPHPMGITFMVIHYSLKMWKTYPHFLWISTSH